MTRRMGYLILVVNLSLLVWAGVIYGLSSLIGGDPAIDPEPTASTE
ncbi:hypothetical protein [Rhizobium sp. G21]|nr:hypothetical protein [Rhizobium sp. G21]MBB1248828.1 hypothetical protein [Rhizobium sp. G21]